MLHTNRVVTVTDTTEAPFEAYLLLELDGGAEIKAMEILPDDVLDIQELLGIYWGPDWTVEVADPLVFNNCATIKTDWAQPQSPICWESQTFDLDMI